MDLLKTALTIDEAAAIGPIGRTSIYQAIKCGELIARKHGKHTFILRDDFDAFLRKQPVMNEVA